MPNASAEMWPLALKDLSTEYWVALHLKVRSDRSYREKDLAPLHAVHSIHWWKIVRTRL